MIDLSEMVRAILTQPSPEALLALQGALLSCEEQSEAAARALAVAGQFHAYLSELESKITARDYSELASRLDMGAVGMVALENLVAADRAQFWERLLLGGLGEGLMVAASRQYVKAWHTEAAVVHGRAAWYLAEALWRVSADLQPGLPPQQRWQAIQSLLAPAHSHDVPAQDKAALLGRIFQILLVTCLAPLLPPLGDAGTARR